MFIFTIYREKFRQSAFGLYIIIVYIYSKIGECMVSSRSRRIQKQTDIKTNVCVIYYSKREHVVLYVLLFLYFFFRDKYLYI